MKEMYENHQVLQHKMHYEEYWWNICGELKVLAMLTGQQA
jgi:hypothetical protein